MKLERVYMIYFAARAMENHLKLLFLLLLSQIYFALSVFIDCWQHLEVKVLTFNHDRRKK